MRQKCGETLRKQMRYNSGGKLEKEKKEKKEVRKNGKKRKNLR